ncbi:MAG: arginase family protein [Acidobacteriota bacterium]
MTNRFLLNPFFLDQPVPGLEPLAEDDWLVNRVELPESTLQTRMSAIHRPFARMVSETLRRKERPVAIVGDCCAALPMAAGLEHAGVDPVLIWLDAHGDFNTWDTTPSGFLGGMPLAMLVGRGDDTLMNELTVSRIPEEQVVLTDARDLDPGERQLLAASSVRHLDDATLLLSDELPPGPVWVHFDVDILDPEDAPAVHYPAAGGLRATQLDPIFRTLAQQREIVAVSVSTWSPQLDPEGQTRELCMGLVDRLLGSA